jgi:hypothetical protein
VQSVPGEEEGETFKREIKGKKLPLFMYSRPIFFFFFQSRSCELKGEEKTFFLNFLVGLLLCGCWMRGKIDLLYSTVKYVLDHHLYTTHAKVLIITRS